MIAKLAIVEEEADESAYWLELLSDAKVVPEDQLRALRNEANALVAMTVASMKTLRNRKVSAAS
jgi:four helix bundle protein